MFVGITYPDQELNRLRALQKVNRAIRPEEIRSLETQPTQLEQAMASARLRLDALRLIHAQAGPEPCTPLPGNPRTPAPTPPDPVRWAADQPPPPAGLPP